MIADYDFYNPEVWFFVNILAIFVYLYIADI